LLIISAYIVFLIIFRKKGIIKDTGFLKSLFFAIGLILIYISNMFASYTSFKECSLHFIIRHIGMMTVIIIFYIYISLAYELGISNTKNEDDKLKMVKTLTTSINDLSTMKHKKHSKSNRNSAPKIEKSFNTSTNATTSIISNFSDGGNRSEISQPESKKGFLGKIFSLFSSIVGNESKLSLSMLYRSNEDLKQVTQQPRSMLKRNIKNAHSLFIEVIVLFPLYILITIGIPIVKSYLEKEPDDYYITQSKDGKWYFKCKMDSTHFIYSFFEEMLIVVILIKGKYVLNFNCIFKITRYISYANLIQIILGPFIYVIIYIILILKKNTF